MSRRAVFALPEPPVDAIPFVLTPQERDKAASARLHLEKLRRKRNQEDAARGVALELQKLDGERA